MTPLLSIIIPTYNEANRIEKTIVSLNNFLRGQQFEWELIISDDGSTDSTPEIVESVTPNMPHPRLIVCRHAGKGNAVWWFPYCTL